jgi:hypothetical protein
LGAFSVVNTVVLHGNRRIFTTADWGRGIEDSYVVMGGHIDEQCKAGFQEGCSLTFGNPNGVMLMTRPSFSTSS